MFRSGLGFSGLRKWARFKRLLRSGIFSGLLLVCSCSNPNPPKTLTTKQNAFEDSAKDSETKQEKLAELPLPLIEKILGHYQVLEEKCRMDGFIVAAEQELRTLDIHLTEAPDFELNLTEQDSTKNVLTEMQVNLDSYKQMLWSESSTLFWSNCAKANISDDCSLRKIKSLNGPGLAKLAYEIKTQFKIGNERHIYRCQYLFSK